MILASASCDAIMWGILGAEMQWSRIRRYSAWFILPFGIALTIFALSFYGAQGIVEAGKVHAFLKSDADWTQAIGAVFAIVAGFAGVLYQVQRESSEARQQEAATGRAAHLIAYDALNTVSERLDAALVPQPDVTRHKLRGNRTNEMVTAMREFEISRIPTSLLADFIRLRSRVYAINQRITELYVAESAKPEGTERDAMIDQRYKWLTSAVVVWREAVVHYQQLEAVAIRDLGATAQQLTTPSSITNYVRPIP